MARGPPSEPASNRSLSGSERMLFGKKQSLVGLDIGSHTIKAVELGARAKQELPARPLGNLAAARRGDRRRRDHGSPARHRRDLQPARVARHQARATWWRPVSGRAVIVKKITMNRLSPEDAQQAVYLGSRAARPLRHQRRVARLRDPRPGAERPEADAGAAGRGEEGHGDVVQRSDPRSRTAAADRGRRLVRRAERARGQLRLRAGRGGRDPQHRRRDHQHQHHPGRGARTSPRTSRSAATRSSRPPSASST